MKRFKSIFLVLVIMLLSLGLTPSVYARERNGSSGWKFCDEIDQYKEVYNEIKNYWKPYNYYNSCNYH